LQIHFCNNLSLNLYMRNVIITKNTHQEAS